MFYYIKGNFKVKKTIINDVNKELILTYHAVKQDLQRLIAFLERYLNQYLPLADTDRKKYFYDLRAHFNADRFNVDYNEYSENRISRAAQVFFFYKTCFNGLFRFNRQGEFNTPYGSYKNPTIFDPVNLQLIHKALEDTKIHCRDFEELERFIGSGAFVHLDPPYRPLNQTSGFTSYSVNMFEDKEQIWLAFFLWPRQEKY